jgi:hypothetical protein
MLLALYLVLWASAGYATKAWAVKRDDELIPMATSIAIGLWGILAVTSEITIYHQDGTSTAVAVGSLQWAPIVLTVLSFGALVLWYFGAYPPQHTETYGDDIA